jgi:hypothetical protein
MVNYNRVIGWSHGAPPTPAEIKKSSSSKRPAPAPMQTMSKAEYDKVFADYRAGTITQAQAVGQLKGSEAQASFQADLQRQQELKKQQEAQRQAEIQRQQEIEKQRQIEAQKLAEQQRQAQILKQQQAIYADAGVYGQSNSTSPTIETYRPLTIKERIKAKSFTKTKGMETPTPAELKEAGYVPLETPASLPGGTIIYTPEGEPVKEYTKPTEYISPSEGIFPVESLTKYDTSKEILKSAEKPIENIQQKYKERKAKEFENKDNQLFQDYQNKVTNQEITTEEAQKKYDMEREKLLENVNKELQEEIKKDPLYQERVKEWEKTAQKLGAGQSYSGSIRFSELDKERKGWGDKTISEKAESIFSYTPLTYAPIRFSKILKEVQETPGYYEGMPGVTTTYYGSAVRDKQLQRDLSSTDLSLGTQISGLVTAGFVLAGAGLQIRSLTKSANEEEALKIINQKIKDGTMRLSKENLKTGTFNVKVQDFRTGQPITQKLKVSPQEVQRISNQIKLREEYLKLYRLGDFRKVDVKMTGTITEREIIKNALASEIKKNPDLINKLNTAEIGRFDAVTKLGKKETGYIVQAVDKTDGKGKVLTYIIKTTKDGNIKSWRLVKTDLETAQKIVMRSAYPSELGTKQIPIKDQSPLQIQEINRMKAIRIFKDKTDYTQLTKTEGDRLIRVIKKESTLFEVGKGAKGTGIKGTTSFQDIYTDKTPLIFKGKFPEPVSLSKSIRVESLGKAKDLTLQYGDDAVTVSKKIGTERTGIFIERARVESLLKPSFTFDIEPFKVSTKAIKGFIDTPPIADKIVEPTKTISKVLSSGDSKILPISAIRDLTTPALDVQGALMSYDRLPPISTFGITRQSLGVSNLFVAPPVIDVKKTGIDALQLQTSLMDISATQKTLQDTGVKQEMGMGTLTTSFTGTRAVPDTSLIQLPVQQPITDISPILSPIVTPRTPSLTARPSPRVTSDFFFPKLPNLGEIQTGGGQKRKPSTSLFGGKTTYTPSLGAVLLRTPKRKVKKGEKVSLGLKKYTGFELRPELEEEENGKKKKKKK